MKISLAKQARARLINTKVSVFKYRLWYQRNIYRWLSVGREFTNDHRSGANTIRAKRQIKNRVRLAWRHTEKKVGRTARSVTRFVSEANEKLTRRETHINNKRTHLLINKIPSHPSLIAWKSWRDPQKIPSAFPVLVRNSETMTFRLFEKGIQVDLTVNIYLRTKEIRRECLMKYEQAQWRSQRLSVSLAKLIQPLSTPLFFN